MIKFRNWYESLCNAERDAALYLVAALSGCGLPVIAMTLGLPS